jgi:hypothetical protein
MKHFPRPIGQLISGSGRLYGKARRFSGRGKRPAASSVALHDALGDGEVVPRRRLGYAAKSQTASLGLSPRYPSGGSGIACHAGGICV